LTAIIIVGLLLPPYYSFSHERVTIRCYMYMYLGCDDNIIFLKSFLKFSSDQRSTLPYKAIEKLLFFLSSDSTSRFGEFLRHILSVVHTNWNNRNWSRRYNSISNHE